MAAEVLHFILAKLTGLAQRRGRRDLRHWGRQPESQSLCYPVARHMRVFPRALATLLLSALLLFAVTGDLKVSALDLVVLPYRYQLVPWELTHLPDKLYHKLTSYLPWRSVSEEERLENVQEFFTLGERIRSLEDSLVRGEPPPDIETPSSEGSGPTETLRETRGRRSDLQAEAEETLEAYISTVAREEGLDGWLGIIFPPIDVALESPPLLLTISPRHTIRTEESILLRPDIPSEEMEALEDTILHEENMSALVEGLGGVATYPSVVNDRSGLRSAAITSAHEWLHTYWFIRPLGWNYWSSPEMTTLNETAASLAGREMGLRTYSTMKGEPYESIDEGGQPAHTGPADHEAPEADTFSFRREMHETRHQVDDLLEQGRIEAAEEYMEARRLVFVEEGYPIRKLNQAYFAFYGTYADNPASVSPIGEEVFRMRDICGSLGDFVRTMSGFDSYEKFKASLASRNCGGGD